MDGDLLENLPVDQEVVDPGGVDALEEVLRWAGDWPVLPVVNRGDRRKLEGVLSLADILRAFRQATAE